MFHKEEPSYSTRDGKCSQCGRPFQYGSGVPLSDHLQICRECEEANQRKHSGGNCYEANLELFMVYPIAEDQFLCHGDVYHPETGWHGHCWIEVVNHYSGEEMVVDHSNGLKILADKADYYERGQCRNVRMYSFEEVVEHVLETMHYGPWEEAAVC